MKQISVGYTDTPISGTPTLARGKLNFGADFRVKDEGAGKLILTNITSPLDRNEEIMYSTTSVANIYDKTSIDPSVYAPSRKGVNLYSKITDIYEVTDSTDADFLIQLPVSVSITIRTANSPYIDANAVQAVVARAVSTLYDTDSESITRLNALLRGSLKPSDL